MVGFDLPQRFWAKVHKGGPHQCWNWTGSTNGRGYGEVYWEGKTLYAHRVAAMASGVDVFSVSVRHTCDNPRCVNPAHLITGTHAENMQDFAARSHGNRGEANGMGKLDRCAVGKMRAEHASAPRSAGGTRVKKGTLTLLARKYGVTASAVNMIVHGQRWGGQS